MRTKAAQLFVTAFTTMVVVFVFSTMVGSAEWSAEVTMEPDWAYQSTPFECHVMVKNVGNSTMHVTNIDLSIVCDWCHGDITDHFNIFKGDQTILPGESHLFRKSVTSGFYGSFYPTDILVHAYDEGDAVLANRTYHFYMSFKEAPPSLLDFAVFFIILPPFFFICAAGITWERRLWMRHEIENALNTKHPDALLRFKWWPYYWENEGQMWLVYFVWAHQSIFLTLLLVFGAILFTQG